MPRGCWHFVSLRPPLPGQGEPVGASRELSPLPSGSPSGTNRKPEASPGGCTDHGAASGSSPRRTDVGKDVPCLAHTPHSLGAQSPPLTRGRTNSQACSQLRLGLDWSCQPPRRANRHQKQTPITVHYLQAPSWARVLGPGSWGLLKGNLEAEGRALKSFHGGLSSRDLLTLAP